VPPTHTHFVQPKDFGLKGTKQVKSMVFPSFLDDVERKIKFG